MSKTVTYLSFAALLGLTACMSSGPPRLSKSEATPAQLVRETPFDRPGFIVREFDGRLYVFPAAAPEAAGFEDSAVLRHSVTRIGVGPQGMTVRAPDRETIDAYLIAREGFRTEIVDGRVWILRAGSAECDAFDEGAQLRESVTRVGAAPNGMSARSVDNATLDDYLSVAR
ncbi:MAG: hypothetical protein NXI31_18495 [bacterium]|nr:hypothetical protein [bacterium]